MGLSEVPFKPSSQPGGCDFSGPRKEAHLVWYVPLVSFSGLLLAPAFNDFWDGVLLWLVGDSADLIGSNC